MPSPSKLRRDSARATARAMFLATSSMEGSPINSSSLLMPTPADPEDNSAISTNSDTMTTFCSKETQPVNAIGNVHETVLEVQSDNADHDFTAANNINLHEVPESDELDHDDLVPYEGPLPLYADDVAPRLQSLVVVRCERVDDDSGVWGSLPEWAGMTEAYLPPGRISMKNKEQRKFLAVAKKRNVHFVAEVLEVDEVYSDRGDWMRYHVTLDRRAISRSDDDVVQERWHHAERAGRLVDSVAKEVGIPRSHARQMLLYPCYKHSLPGVSESVGFELHSFLANLGDEGADPEEAAVKFLACLGHPAADPNVVLRNMDLPPEFAKALIESCREERRQHVRPRQFSKMYDLRPTQCVAGILLMKDALIVAERLPPPEGCAELQVSIDGAGRYKFSTICTEDYDEVAASFLATAFECAQAWLTESQEASIVEEKEHLQESAVPPTFNPDACCIGKQPVLSIGLIGDVANGKSTLCKALTGKRTQQHSSEHQAHGATIRLGYANCGVYRCTDLSCAPPGCFSTAPDDTIADNARCSACGSAATIVRRVSFVDCPGHAELMATMLAGASIFDAAILVASANAPCPSPQAAAHINALAVAGHSLKGKIATVQTKADLLVPSASNANVINGHLEQHARKAADAFLGSEAEGAPVFPVATPHDVGLDAIAMWLASLPDRPTLALTAVPRMHCLRSWDINYPGTHAVHVQGGVIGGALVQGTLQTGNVVEIRPGAFTEHQFSNKKNARRTQRYFTVEPLLTRVQQAKSGEQQLSHVGPGGLIALSTTLCPTFSADDRLQGCVIGLPGSLPPIWETLCLVGLAAVNDASVTLQGDDEESDTETCQARGDAAVELQRMEVGAQVRLHAGSASVRATVTKFHMRHCKLVVELHRPLCADLQSNVAIEAKRGESYRLVAHARIADGRQCHIVEPEMRAGLNLQNGSKDAEDAEAHHQAVSPLPSVQCSLQSKAEIDPVPDEVTIDLHEVHVDKALGMCDAMTIDLHESEFFRERLLDNLLTKMGGIKGGGEGIKVPPPELSREGGAHCIWKNFSHAIAKLNRPPAHFLSFLAAEGLSCHRAGEVTLFKYTWSQQKKKPLSEELKDVRKGWCIPLGDWERCVFITTTTGRQVRISAELDFAKQQFPLEVSLKDAILRIGSRGLGGPGKIYSKLCGLIRLYARTFVVCQQCRSACTQLERDRKLHHAKIELVCSNCSARRFVPSQFDIGS